MSEQALTEPQPAPPSPAALATFRIDPELLEAGKKTTVLARTEQLTCAVMVAAQGGENFLHQHPDLDQVFIVLSGQATFYTGVEQVGAVVGPLEGVVVPRGTAYWYETSGAEDLVLLRIGAHPAGEEQPYVRMSENLRTASPVKAPEGQRLSWR